MKGEYGHENRHCIGTGWWLGMTDEFLNLLAFLILIAGDEVMSKSPSYILEKYSRYMGGLEQNLPRYETGLDGRNRALFDLYQVTWGLK